MDRAATVDGDYGCRGTSVCPSGAGRPRSAQGDRPNITDESETGHARTAKSTRRLLPLLPMPQRSPSPESPPPSTPKLNPHLAKRSCSSREIIFRLRNLPGWRNTKSTLLRRRVLVPTTPSSTSVVGGGRNTGWLEQNSNPTAFRRVCILSTEYDSLLTSALKDIQSSKN